MGFFRRKKKDAAPEANNLSSVKQEVSNTPESTNAGNYEPAPDLPKLGEQMPDVESSSIDNVLDDVPDTDDSLENLNTQSLFSQETKEAEPEPVVVPQSFENYKDKTSQTPEMSFPKLDEKFGGEELNMDDVEELNFIKNKDVIKAHKDEHFITTTQYKTMTALIEKVRDKINKANETHLKILDIRAEEDIEFENLRKDFLFVEKKLYEVDGLVFNNLDGK